MTGAYFSDTETSTGNTFTAGAIDLGIDNESYYNGVKNDGTSWIMTYDLDDGAGAGPNGEYFFFNFSDLKPGDWGEDTISLHVNNNDAWVCAEITLTGDYENDIVEPEMDLGDTAPEGELDGEVKFIVWADDGDNVLEDNEMPLLSPVTFSMTQVGAKVVLPVADSNYNIFTGLPNDPLTGAETHYVGKAWCFGEFDLTNIPLQDGGDQGRDPSQPGMGIVCNGANVGNLSQSDSMTADIGFTAVQSRNNAGFICQ